MGLISYTNIEDGFSATANLWNSRFGDIVNVINGNIDAQNIKNGSITAAKIASSVFEAMYPIGSLYFNAVDGTNPSILLGFGTWTAHAQDRQIMGVGTDEATNAPGKTGGAKTINLAHSHTVNSHNHFNGQVLTGPDSTNHTHNVASGSGSTITSSGINNTHGHAYDRATGDSAPGTNSQLSSTQSIVDPFVADYIWQRVS